ncbi:BZ3500_MvSof-1268-A1-R1_Chr6-2g08533 [Microbotryum saponariae]|uniref:Ribosome biogenesis regulatory protein n=1 Tax=Microbotryum saponariae TaxID=289078 RepID=A0A2X0LQJ2_9BASI|nr:BZ3500_MvSof-1268-A1-R1_Chr6-2g08533 [Microbotryum saponariae]SDA07810.1 BZ3501_MvSof-1269-A2-R1_Chr6-1g08247 [Microbotryum saponariae]
MDVSELLEATSSKQLPIQVPKEIPVEIDLGLMAILDPNPIEDEVYKMDREQTLLSHARDGIQLLVNGIWNQPTRLVDDGVVADLPPISTELPREKPLPKAKAMTKWQAFATAKGIAPKPKKDRMVFDEEKQDWVPRWGYKGKNKESEDQWITEVPDYADNSFDPVANSKQERTARKAKNETQRLKNMQRAAANAATQVATNQANASEREKRKVQLERELKITKKATASMGKFDAQLKGENAEKNVKRKFDPNEVDAKAERNKAMSILTKIGATPSNKRTKVSDDAPTAGKDVSAGSMINERKAIKQLTGGQGALSMGQRGGRGGKGGGRGGGRGGRGRK